MFSFFTQEFMVLATLLGLAVGLSAALISPFLVLNHQSNIADGLSHVAFTGIVFGALLLEQPIYFAIPFAVAASLLISFLGQLKMIEHDGAIGVVASFALAVGLIVIQLSSGLDFSVENLLVGQMLTVTIEEVIIAIVFLVIVIAFIILLYRKLLLVTYDPTYAQFSKIKHKLLRYSLSALVAVFIVLGVRTVGMLSISAFIIFPSLIASQLSKSFKSTLLISSGLALITVFISITISYNLNLPTGPTIVVLYTVLLAGAITYRKLLRRD